MAAADEAQEPLADGPVRVRMGLHSGEPIVTAEGYVGSTCTGQRGSGAGHGGQVLVSETTRQLLDDAAELRDLGMHRLKDLGAPQRLFQLGAASFRRLQTLYRTNLPIQPTPLVGRERELAEAAARPRGSARHPHRARRKRQDEARASARRRARRRVRGRRLLGSAPALRRPGAGRAAIAQRSAPTTAWPSTSATNACCSCSTISSRSSTRHRASPPCWRGFRRDGARYKPWAAASSRSSATRSIRFPSTTPSHCSASVPRRSSTDSSIDAVGDLPPAGRPSAGDRARRCAHRAPPRRRIARAARAASADAHIAVARRSRATADAARDDRVELRSPRARRAGPVPRPRIFRGSFTLEAAEAVCDAELDVARVAPRQEPRSPLGERTARHARHDPRVRKRASRGVRRGGASGERHADFFSSSRNRQLSIARSFGLGPAARPRDGRCRQLRGALAWAIGSGSFELGFAERARRLNSSRRRRPDRGRPVVRAALWRLRRCTVFARVTLRVRALRTLRKLSSTWQDRPNLWPRTCANEKPRDLRKALARTRSGESETLLHRLGICWILRRGDLEERREEQRRSPATRSTGDTGTTHWGVAADDG